MKCDRCKGMGAYSYVPEPSKEQREDGSTFPSRLFYTPKNIITKCERCNGIGEYEEKSFSRVMENEINKMKNDLLKSHI